MLLKSKVDGRIFQYTEHLFKTNKFTIYEPLLTVEEEDTVDENINDLIETFKNVPKNMLTKDLAEIYLDKLLTDKEYKTLIERVYG